MVTINKENSRAKEIISLNAPLRLVSADDVKSIICKYENRIIQRTMIFEIEKLNGCLATEEQQLQILGEKEIIFKD